MIGFFIGILRGAGASVASAVAYGPKKRASDREGTFGTGDPRGLAAPEGANNAAAGGAMVPVLTLGIPGSGIPPSCPVPYRCSMSRPARSCSPSGQGSRGA